MGTEGAAGAAGGVGAGAVGSGTSVGGGVDAGAVVTELGSRFTRCGIAGDDIPRAIFRSAYAPRAQSDGKSSGTKSDVAFGDALLAKAQFLTDVAEFPPPDSEEFAALLASALRTTYAENPLAVGVSARPMIVVEPSETLSKAARARLAQVMFEREQSPALFFLRGAAGAAFSAARSTALVLDIGNRAAVATPVADGYALLKSAQSAPHLGASALTDAVADLVLEILTTADKKGSNSQANTSAEENTESADVRMKSAVSASPPLLGVGQRSTKRRRAESEDGAASAEPRTASLQATPSFKKEHSASEREQKLASRLLSVEQLSASDVVRKAGWHRFYRNKLLEDIKQALVWVSESPIPSRQTGALGSAELEQQAAMVAARRAERGAVVVRNGAACYELPDGEKLEVPLARCDELSERLFAHSALLQDLRESSGDQVPPQIANALGSGGLGLHTLAFNTMSACDTDIRRELANGVVLCGGGSQLQGALAARLQAELAVLVPQMYKLRVMSPQIGASAAERASASWVGGSILGSLGTFQQMWVSKADYSEHGENIIHTKCP